MPRCPDPVDLSRFADGELPADERRVVDRHLQGCADCRAAVAEERALGAALGKAVCPDPASLALFIDDALGPPGARPSGAPTPRLDVVAAHVLACEPCRTVVAWTRDAGAATLSKTESRSGRKRPRLRARPAVPSWLPAAAGIAAAVLILLVLARPDRRTPVEAPQQARTERPAPPRTETPRPTERPTPRPTEPAPVTEEPVAPTEPGPVTDEPPAPTETPGPTPPAAGPAAPTEPGPGVGTTTTAPPPTAPAPIEVAALPGGTLRWRDPAGAEGALDGPAALPPGTRLLGGRQGGGLRLGEVTCFLDGQSVLRLAEPEGDVGRVELLDGQLSVDAKRPAIEVACGPAVVRPLENGVFMVIAADGPERALLSVVSGGAAVGSEHVAAGEAARVERGGRLRPVKSDPKLARAEDLATTASLARGVDFPGGVRARRALAAAASDLAGGDAERRAWSAYAVLAVHRAGPRLTRLAEPHLDAARRATAELAALPADALGRAATPLLLALGTRDARGGGAPLGRIDDATLERLAEALATRPAPELAADADALLALRVAERLTSFKAPRAVWAAAAALPLEGPAAGARAVLARRPVDANARKQLLADLDALLAQDPLSAPADPASLLAAARSLALLAALTDERRARVLAHAGAPDRTDPRLAVAVAHDSFALAGAGEPATASEPASVVVEPLDDKTFRVTFVFASARRPKQVLLCGTWDTWAEPGLPMRERPDGTFTATIVLPAGRHEYKMRLGVGGVWEPDARNPITTADGMGGLNSVLILE